MTTMLPALLAGWASRPDPDEAFRRFDRFIGALPAGVQLMSLFQRNPLLLERIAAVLGAAPLLADTLPAIPARWRACSRPRTCTPPRGCCAPGSIARRDLEDAIQIVRRAVKEKDFFLSVATLEGRSMPTPPARSAPTWPMRRCPRCARACWPISRARYGKVPGGALAVVAMGKAGGREMMAGSDLDLMFIYDHRADVTESRGARPLAASQWFVRRCRPVSPR